ncbi:MAG: uroporphyrinogen-III synthase [Legionella sp.]|nr:uroporphyrinogen-III synthase [Legionella sp.]
MQGLRVLNTRPELQGKKLSQAIKQLGGISIDCPALAIEPVKNNWVREITPCLKAMDFAIFTSTNAVNYALSSLLLFHRWPEKLRAIPIGQTTANALAHYGIAAYFIPDESRSESLLAHPYLQKIEGKKVLLFKGEKGRTCIQDTLCLRGAECVEVDVYRRVLPLASAGILHRLQERESIDIMLITSQEAIQNILTLWDKKLPTWIFDTPCLVISQRLASFVSTLGFKTILISKPETVLQTLNQFDQGFDYGRV